VFARAPAAINSTCGGATMAWVRIRAACDADRRIWTVRHGFARRGISGGGDALATVQTLGKEVTPRRCSRWRPARRGASPSLQSS
jgi:hypothetical protein